MGKLIELAERAERATGPDRELDVLIWADQIGQTPEWQGGCLVVGIEGVVAWVDPGEHSRNFYTNKRAIGPGSIPAFTASIDAAMQLVPEGWLVEQLGEMPFNEYPDRPWMAQLRPREFGKAHERKMVLDCFSAALALCASSLRARDGGEGL